MTEQNIQEAVTGLMQRIIDHSTTAQRLKSEFVADMQKDQGYRITDAGRAIPDVLAKYTAGEYMPRGLANGVSFGLFEKIETTPSNELISAVDALESDVKNLQGLISSFTTQYNVSVKTGRKSTGTRSTGAPGQGKLAEVLSIDPNARIALVDVGMSHPHIQGVLSNGKSIDIDCYAATLTEHVYKALGRA